MTPSEVKAFERFLSDSFEEGIRTRQLRLSEVEVALLIEQYPVASVQQFSVSDEIDGKVWYEVSIR